jgi:S-DNA-T family DNA segregation ATPase FtsK/SpoIIIE
MDHLSGSTPQASSQCDECGFDYDDVTAASVPNRLRNGARDLAETVRIEGDDVRIRPTPETWSPLEYACHVRDVARTQRDRMELALREDCPRFAPMGRDQKAIDDRYNEQDPDEVCRELVASCNDLADYLETLLPEERARTGIYLYPAEAERTIVWIGINTVHELVHHRMDVQRVR